VSCSRGLLLAGLSAAGTLGWSRAVIGGTVFIDQRALDAAAGELAVAILSDPRHASQVEAATARHEEEAAALDSLIAEAEQTALALAGRLGRGERTWPGTTPCPARWTRGWPGCAGAGRG